MYRPLFTKAIHGLSPSGSLKAVQIAPAICGKAVSSLKHYYDEKALAACMAYVDLNPVRAAMAKTPEESQHTSVKKRAEKAKEAYSPNHTQQQVPELLNFAGNPKQDMPEGIPMRLTDYLELVESFVSSMRLTLRAA